MEKASLSLNSTDSLIKNLLYVVNQNILSGGNTQRVKKLHHICTGKNSTEIETLAVWRERELPTYI